MPRPTWLSVVERVPPPPPTMSGGPTAISLPGDALRAVFHRTFPGERLAAAHAETAVEANRFVARVRELDPAAARVPPAELVAHPAVQTALHEFAEKFVRRQRAWCG
jgi:hypothetical protein